MTCNRRYFIAVAALIASVIAATPYLSAATVAGARQTIPRIGLSWITSDIDVSAPDHATDSSPALIKSQDLTGYFLRLDSIREQDGTPRFTRASAEQLVRDSWNALKDDDTRVSVISQDNQFVRKDDGQLTVDRLSVRVTRDGRTLHGIAYIIQAKDALIVAVFVTESRVAAIDNIIQTIESVVVQ